MNLIFLGGPCESCGRRTSGIWLLETDFNVCLHCKTNDMWMTGDLRNDSDEEQAKDFLIIENTESIE